MNEDDRKVDSANEYQSSDILSTPDSIRGTKLEFSFSKLARTRTDPFARKYGTGSKWFLFQSQSKSQEMISLDDAKVAVAKAREQEQVLAHALSRTQTMLSEKAYMLEKAVAVGEQYKKRLEDYTVQLEEYQAENLSLRTELEMMKGRHAILKDTIDDQQIEIASLIGAIKIKDPVITNASAMVPKKNELSSENVDLENMEAGIHEVMKQLKLDLEWEKCQRIELEKEKSWALNQLTDIKKELESSRSKVSVLEKALTEHDENYRYTIFSLTSEKALLEKDYTEVLNAYNELEEKLLPQLGTCTSKPSYKISLGKLSPSENMPSKSRLSLEQVNMSLANLERLVDNSDVGGNSPGRVNFGSGHWSLISMEKTVCSPASATRDLIQEYLHITAVVVKLHFPDLKDVSSIWLIDTVRSSPFYLYYDVMMNIMRQIEREQEAIQDEGAQSVRTAPIENIDDNKQPGWMSRFQRLTRGKSKAKKKCTKIRL